MNKFMRIVFWLFLVCFMFLIVAAATDITVPSNTQGTSRDLFLYRSALISVFSSFAICCLVGLLGCYFPKIQKIKLAPKLLVCTITLTAGIITFGVLYSSTSDVFRNELSSTNEDYQKTVWPLQNNNETTVSGVPSTEHEEPNATTDHTDTEGTICTTEPSIADNADEPTQKEDEYVTEDAPLTLIFNDDVFTVGNCDFTLDKLEMVYEPYKSYLGTPSYAKYIRVHLTVTNKSSQSTTFYAKKMGSWIIGLYYTSTGTVENIGANNNYKWHVDSHLKSASDFALDPQETKNICVTGVFINDEKIKYDDLPKIDLFFQNEAESLTVSLN